mmetsp:Transcript_7915/g.28930  ORF Transcript_7915/g.28930 Transcript_7915/m.28930 type:complete len:409 (+) Transcript_7915:1075-2301(+)
MTPVFPSKPSISVRSWLIVCSRSSLPPPMPAPRWRPTASISSMKTMHGAFDLAFSNKSRTRDAPTPTKSSTNSDAAHEKNGTPASPATALARRVLPVPGGPTRRQPLGIFAPSAVYLSGFLRKSTTSWSSSFAPSTPATSTNVTPVSGTSWNLDLDLPKSIGPPPPMPPKPPPPPPSPPCARRNKKNNPPNARSGKRRLPARLAKLPCCSPSETEMSTPFLARMSTSSGSFGSVTAARRPSTAVSWRDDPSLANRTRSTLPFCTALMNSEYRHVFPSGSAFGSATAVDGAVCESASENADLADCWNCASADVGASAVAGGAKSSAIATRLVAPDAARNAMKDAAVVARVLSSNAAEDSVFVVARARTGVAPARFVARVDFAMQARWRKAVAVDALSALAAFIVMSSMS